MNLTNEQIVELLHNYDKQSRALKKDLLKICWYMRGSITYDIALMLDYEERKMISEVIEDNMENTKKSGYAFI